MPQIRAAPCVMKSHLCHTSERLPVSCQAHLCYTSEPLPVSWLAHLCHCGSAWIITKVYTVLKQKRLQKNYFSFPAAVIWVETAMQLAERWYPFMCIIFFNVYSEQSTPYIRIILIIVVRRQFLRKRREKPQLSMKKLRVIDPMTFALYQCK